jgi:hypothetical protein
VKTHVILIISFIIQLLTSQIFYFKDGLTSVTSTPSIFGQCRVPFCEVFTHGATSEQNKHI